MKKNIVGHMVAERESVGTRIRRWNILPKLVCLLLAVIIWLTVVNLGLDSTQEAPAQNDPAVSDTAS